MYLWKFHAAVAWLEAHEAALCDGHEERMAVIQLPGRARMLVQITCRRRMEGEALVRRWGGALQQLSRDWPREYLSLQKRTPLRVGRRLVVLSESGVPNEKHLLIPSAGAFGTGEHATTAMSLRLLEETTRTLSPGWRMLDAGSGTGILALAGARFGAGNVLGLDDDPRAIAHARENARRNRIRAQFVRHDLLTWNSGQRYDVITANLFSELLIAAVPIFRRALQPRGTLIVSGILREQAEKVERVLRRAGFLLDRPRRRGKWVALRCVSGKKSGRSWRRIRTRKTQPRCIPSVFHPC